MRHIRGQRSGVAWLDHAVNSLVINGQVRPFRLVERLKKLLRAVWCSRILLVKELPLRAVVLDQQGVVFVQGLEPNIFA